MKKNKIIKLLIAVVICGCLNAQTNSGKAKSAGGKKTSLNYEYALNDPLKARIYTLKNGMKVYLSVYKNEPRIHTFIAVKAGSKNDPSNCTGLAHYLEHMVFKGTDKFGTKDWTKESAELKKIEDLYEVYRKTTDEAKRKNIYHQIDSISGVAARYSIANEYDKMLAAIGADGTNAFTSFDQTVYVNNIPSNQADNWLKIESERFSKLVLRLFHTELEAVYEEKNRNIDSDENKVFEAIMESLFKKHTYGTQTTIGTIDHLKNPSMTEIHKYFEKYYVPNNMAIIMSGDFDPDKMIVDIEKYFGKFKSKPVDVLKFEPEAPIKEKIIMEVAGPDPASVNIGWRAGGAGTKDDDICTIISSLLNNGTAGLMDIHLNQEQKVLSSYCLHWPLKDYALFGLTAQPKEGQSLEEAEKLLLGEMEKIKKGDFPDWLLEAVLTDLELRRTRELEYNYSRANKMLDAFVNGVKWAAETKKPERLSKISKQEIIDFASKNFLNDNYVVVYKRTGEDTTVKKVEKPEITPVEVDLENASPFVKSIMQSQPKNIEPKFIDYDKDIQKTEIKNGISLLYNHNAENKLFELYYKFDLGKTSDKTLAIAVKYIPFLSTINMNAARVKEEFYKLGCYFDVFCDKEDTWINLSGLNDNFEKALQLFEMMLAEPVVDGTVLQNLKANIIKERNDFKLQKNLILNNGMVNYGLYGPVNPNTYVLSDEELDQISVEDVVTKIINLTRYKHKVLYYGPKELEEVKTVLNRSHIVPAAFLPTPPPYRFEMKQLDNTVYVVDYDMKQAEMILLSNGGSYDPAMVPIISLYNTYFGAGMSSVVFQDLRESKALAYSTYSRYKLPNKLSEKSYNISYIGSQADKLPEALSGMKELLSKIPKAENSFSASKEMLLQDIRTQRIIKSEVIFNYLNALELGLKSDIRKDVFEKVKNYTFEDVKKFHAENISIKPTTLLVLGKKDKLDLKILEKYGTVKFLDLKDIFGY